MVTKSKDGMQTADGSISLESVELTLPVLRSNILNRSTRMNHINLCREFDVVQVLFDRRYCDPPFIRKLLTFFQPSRRDIQCINVEPPFSKKDCTSTFSSTKIGYC